MLTLTYQPERRLFEAIIKPDLNMRKGSPAGSARAGISRPSWRLQRHLTTRADESSPPGEIPPPRVQALVEPGKMRGFLCPRTDCTKNQRAALLTREFALDVAAGVH